MNFAPTDHLPKPIRQNTPDIKLDGIDMPAFHPILTTDYFEFGTSVNHLEQIGCAVEMGDAALGLAIEERGVAGKTKPNWLVIRNCSDPQINGALRNHPATESAGDVGGVPLRRLWVLDHRQQCYRNVGFIAGL